MNWEHTLLTISLLAIAALVLKPLSNLLRLPYPALLVAAGFLLSELLVAQGIDTGLRWHNFRDLAYYVLLPLLIYEMAFCLSAEHIFKNLLGILLLSIPFMLAAILIAALLLFYGIDHVAYPFTAALLTAALLSMNDPAAVGGVLNRLNTSPRLIALLKGESLFNTIVALVLVTLALNVELMEYGEGEGISFLAGFILFVKLFSGGILVGAVTGLVGWLLMYYARLPLLRLIISFALVYASFLLAEQWLQVSGIVSVLTAGLMLNAYSHQTDDKTRQLLRGQWSLYAAVAGASLFLLLGVSVYLPLLQNQWLAVLIAIGALLIARGIIVFGGFWLIGKFAKKQAIPTSEKIPLAWGGIKGAMAVALMFSLPDLDYSSTVHAVVYGVVLFSLFVQATTLRFLLPKS